MSAWPFFDLAVRTPRLVLRYADDELLAALTAFRTDRPFPPGAEPFDGDSSFSSFSYVALDQQGKGIGKEMRAAVLGL